MLKVLANLVIGLIIMAVGVAPIIKTEYFLDTFGRIEFFEVKMGTSGGSRLGYKLIGMALVLAGVLVATGMFGGFIAWIFSPLTRFTNPPAPTGIVQ